MAAPCCTPLARSTAASCASGNVKLTPIGSIWLTVTIGVPVGCTRLPRYTTTAPARPDSGDVMVSKLSATSLERIAA